MKEVHMQFKSRKVLWGALGGVLLAALAGGCVSMSKPPDVDQKVDTALLKVSGDNARLVRFDTRLRQALGVGADDSTTLGCKGCANLSNGTTEEVTYIIPRKMPILDTVYKIWNDEWYTGPPPFDAGDKRLVLSLDYNDSPDPVCTGFKSPCFSRPTCRQTAFCSQNSTGSCVPACVR
jgi:hypothetical protein